MIDPKPNLRIKILSLINKLLPKSKRQIAIYGRRMLSDNAEALLDYLISNDYNKKYSIKICVDKHVPVSKYTGIQNVQIVSNPIHTIFTLLNSMRVFHTHGMTACAFIPCRNQIIFDLWHGSPLKTIGLMAGNKWYHQTDSYFLCASPFWAEINKKCFNLDDNQIFIGSYPRNDLLLKKSDNHLLKSICSGTRNIVFMPTFRNSDQLHKTDSSCDFPLLSPSNIEDLNSFLKDKDVNLIIKPHPYQRHIQLFDIDLSNIKIITNEDLHKAELPLYVLLGASDALISDFSSVFFDYLLINRPIAFVVEDMADYKNQRGFTIDNPYTLMPGVKIQTLKDLKEFILDVVHNKDPYHTERQKINNLCNTYTSPDASKRILDFTGIIK